MENGIIINGTNHKAIYDENFNDDCNKCSLKSYCDTGYSPICINLFGDKCSHFEIAFEL